MNVANVLPDLSSCPSLGPEGYCRVPLSSNPPDSSLQDSHLARLIMDGSPSAEEELYLRFAPRVRHFGLRHLRSPAGAEDLTQRVLLLVIEKLRRGEVNNPESIASFVLGVARRMVLEAHRSTQRHQVPLEDAFDVPDQSMPVFEEGDAALRQHLSQGLAELSERERTIVVLTFYLEQTAQEIAAALGVTEGNVRVLRHRALARLRARLTLDPLPPSQEDKAT